MSASPIVSRRDGVQVHHDHAEDRMVLTSFLGSLTASLTPACKVGVGEGSQCRSSDVERRRLSDPSPA